MQRIKKPDFEDDKQLPSVEGETSVGGHMPDPESDDSTLENIKDWGLYKDVDEEHLPRRTPLVADGKMSDRNFRFPV